MFGHYLGSPLSKQKDEQSLRVQQLQNDQNNIRQSQQSYGVPTIGDLFSGAPQDVEETVKSLYFMMKQRVADIDFRQDIRAKLTKQDQTLKEAQDALSKQRAKAAQLETTVKDL